MQRIKKIQIFIEKRAIDNSVERIYELVRSKHYLLKDSRKVLATKVRDFIMIMKTWGWNASADEEGNIIELEYFGNAPLSYQKILFEKIAPDIKPGGFIKFETDESRGAWEFDGKTLINKEA